MRKHPHKASHRQRSSSALMRLVLNRAAPLPATNATTVGIACYLALDALKDGHGNNSNMNQLAYSINLAAALAELGVCTDGHDRIAAAQDALVASNAISLDAGRWIISDDCYRMIRDALAIHDRQMEIASQGEIQAAHRMIQERVKAGDVTHVDVQAR
ncbi:hypothetical protein [Paraburkholderia phytofirmans]|uniref:Fis family transcriptional regulator n=1 Tax=Paraburkholderia phytofirmans (strain DSM 17436 / LMG 22146 / PsJN) TaxID=398527 RepID=B2TH25_PARPJ|nr:hypothetical protein [Paraburkholderia phytofirmans]ACD21574.1 conserved hypothetical protein [Paraburkholderia phytofirmans PsJN]